MDRYILKYIIENMDQKENQTPIYFWIEKYEKKWLVQEAKRQKLSLTELLRYYIRHFMTDPNNQK